MHTYVYGNICVFFHAFIGIFGCMCEKERERERKSERKRERERESVYIGIIRLFDTGA